MSTFNLLKKLSIITLCAVALTACMPKTPKPLSDRDSQLTQGNVEMTLKKGITTKAEVLEKFGAPNVTTRDAQGQEVWTYQRTAQVRQSSAKTGGWTILLAGKSGGGSGFESSSRMMTLIIKFNKKDIVSDFSSRTSNF